MYLYFSVYFIHTGLLDYSWMQLVQNAAAEKEMIQFLPVEKKTAYAG